MKKPLNCYYSKEIIKEADRFEFLTVGAGCIDCILTNSSTCHNMMTQEERNEIQADPDTWNLIAHCNLNQPPQSLAGSASDTGE